MVISKNRYLDAFLKLVLATAIAHMLILFIAAIINADITYLNYFNILDVDLFFPGAEAGMLSHVLSVAAMVVIYSIIYLYFTSRPK